MVKGLIESDEMPFRGLKVIDLSSILAGPLTGSFFAELGAKVIKIENKLSDGDATRQWKLPTESPDINYSAYYFSANYNKKVIMLDLSSKDDQEILFNHIADADILISNYQKTVAAKFGLLPEVLSVNFPKLIISQLSAYDFDDARPGYDLVMQGETGWLSMTGTDDDHLAKLPVALMDIIASHQMKEAILIALIKRSVKNIGSIIHVSLYKSALTALANQASNFLMSGHIARPMGTLHPNICPYGDMFSDKNGKKFILAVGSDGQFKKLWNTLNLPSRDYHIFEINSERLNKRALLQLTLQQSFQQLEIISIRKALTEENIPFCEIKNLSEVLNNAQASEMILQERVEGIVAKTISSIAFKIY